MAQCLQTLRVPTMSKLLNNSALKFGLPFLSFVVLGSFVLREFASIRYEVYSHKKRFGQLPSQTQRKVQFENYSDDANEIIVNEEAEIEKLSKLGANDDWKNIRGPRPWEDNSEFNAIINSKKEKKQD